MRLEDVTARIRPRGAWESVDVGFAMVRRQFGELLLAWCLTVGPLWALLLISMRWIPTGWVIFLIWLLKPFYGRVPLFILSRSLFGAKPTLRETLRAWPRLLFNRFFRLIFTRIAWLVVIPNFAWNRALLLPVLDLENQRGKGFKQRQAVLLRQAGGTSFGLTILLGCYQIALAFALLALGATFNWNPGEADGALQAVMESLNWDVELAPALFWTLMASYLITLTVVELFYIGAGFGLYLNCRTNLEGWDVELTFRGLAQRVAKATTTTAAALSFALWLLLGGATMTAQDLEKPAVAPALQADRQKMEQILKHADFKIYTEEYTTRTFDPMDKPSWGWVGVLGQILYYAALAALAALLVWIIWINRHWFQRDSEKAAPTKARTVMGMAITPESLPADILAAARARWQAGDPRGALSLLYRGALLWLVESARVPIRESDTEGDCLRHSLTVPQPAERDYFNDLTGQWIDAAYGTQLPRAEAMERLLTTWPYQANSPGRMRP